MGPPIPDPSSYGELDEQITCLMRCQPLPEADVKALCDKAREILVRAWPSHLAELEDIQM